MLGSFHYEMLIGFALAVPTAFPAGTASAAARHAAALCAEVFVLLGV